MTTIKSSKKTKESKKNEATGHRWLASTQKWKL